MNSFVLAILSIVVAVVAQFSLKAGMSSEAVKLLLAQPRSIRSLLLMLIHPSIAGGLALYCIGAVLWLGVLAKWDVSKAYPMVGLGFALSVAIGFLTGEQITFARTVGVFLICAGVILVGRN